MSVVHPKKITAATTREELIETIDILCHLIDTVCAAGKDLTKHHLDVLGPIYIKEGKYDQAVDLVGYISIFEMVAESNICKAG
jgi:hypothetical protein